MLCADRFFSVPENETLEALLDKSADDQQEVTDQLGYQVRKAVEVLIQSLDKADQDHGRKLLADVDEKVLYESALTVMMRLVFLFCAEERELLLLGDDLYDKNYAVSTLREQLRAAADQHGEEILGLRLRRLDPAADHASEPSTPGPSTTGSSSRLTAAACSIPTASHSSKAASSAQAGRIPRPRRCP